MSHEGQVQWYSLKLGLERRGDQPRSRPLCRSPALCGEDTSCRSDTNQRGNRCMHVCMHVCMYVCMYVWVGVLICGICPSVPNKFGDG